MGIVVIGAAFVDIKGFPYDVYIPDGRNAGRVEYVHGGVARNVVEDIANVELRPTYLGLVDDSPLGEDVLQKLKNHKVNCDYVKKVDDGMGTWLAVFDNNGDVAGSISKRPNMMPILDVYEKKSVKKEVFTQTSLFELEEMEPVVKEDPLREQLKTLNPLEMTPMEALNYLYTLKKDFLENE